MSSFYISNIFIEETEVFDWLYEKIANISDGAFNELIIETFYSREEIDDMVGGEIAYSEEEGISKLWMAEKTGTEWIRFLFEDGLKMESLDSIPEHFFIKIYKLCQKKFGDITMCVNWLDSSEKHVGMSFMNNNIYIQDSRFYSPETIDDLGYHPKVEEDLEGIKKFLSEREIDFENQNEVNIREIFELIKSQERMYVFEQLWFALNYTCKEIIDNPETEHQMEIIKRI